MKEKLKALIGRLVRLERDLENFGDEILAANLLDPKFASSLEVLGNELTALGDVRYTLEKLLIDWEE